MAEYINVPVCRCDQSGNLGWLRLPPEALHHKHWRVYEMSSGYAVAYDANLSLAETKLDVYDIKLLTLSRGRYDRFIAVNAGERPIEFWRKIYGFTEA